MPCSAARLEANRKNAQRSCGPKTDAGKAASRANALKHGLTGAGVVVPTECAAEIEQRFESIAVELGAEGDLASCLARRVALFTVRLDRSARQEAARLSERVENADAEFDQARLAEVDRLMAGLSENPAAHVRALKRMPEGVDRLIAAWECLRSDLNRGTGGLWNEAHRRGADELLGRHAQPITSSPLRMLTEALYMMDSPSFTPAEGSHIADHDARRQFVRDQIFQIIDAEIASLRTHRETIDLDKIARDRAGAADRALFDTSKEAILARKYEAATERSLFRTLRELRELPPPPPEPEATPEPEPEPESTVEPEPEPLASFFPAPETASGARPIAGKTGLVGESATP